MEKRRKGVLGFVTENEHTHTKSCDDDSRAVKRSKKVYGANEERERGKEATTKSLVVVSSQSDR